MCLFNNISQNSFQPVKIISGYDEELLVTTLSNIISDAKNSQKFEKMQTSHSNSLHSEHATPEQIYTLNPNYNFSSVLITNHESHFQVKIIVFPEQNATLK